MHAHVYECTLSFINGRLAYKDYKEYKDPSPRQSSSSWLPEFRHNSEFRATLLIISTYMIYEKRDPIGPILNPSYPTSGPRGQLTLGVTSPVTACGSYRPENDEMSIFFIV